MNLLSMDNEDFNKSNFFDLLIKKTTYASLFYSILGIPIGLLYLVLTVLSFGLGFMLIPLWIGVPLLIGSFRMLWELSKFEERMYTKYLGIRLPSIAKYNPIEKSSILLLKSYLSSKRSWSRLAYFLLKWLVSTLVFIPTAMLLGLGFSMIYIPINSVFGHINFYGLYETDSFIEVIFIYFLAGIIWVGLVHLVMFSVQLSSKILIRFLCR